MLKMDNDFISTQKMLLVGNNSDAKNNTLLPNNEELLSADYIFENYHSINSFDSKAYPTTGQYLKYSVSNIPFTFSDYEKVRTNDKIIAKNGVDIGFIDTLEWNPITQIATEINYRVNKVYTKNLKTTKIIPDGK